MKTKKKLLYWIPRILSIIAIIFISIFAFDEPLASLGFLIHLLPSFILIIILIIAWKWEFIGGIIYIAIGIVFTIFFKTYEDIIVFLLISLPWIIIGVLFILNSKKKIKKRKK